MARDISAVETLLAEFIAYPTVSSDSNLAMIDRLAELLEAAGARVWTQGDPGGTKANLFATMGPEEAQGGLLLSGHTDVVPVADQAWSSDPFQMVARDELLFGRGACDMKGFIAAAVDLAARVDAGSLREPLHFAFTRDEEVGCVGAKALVEVLRDRDIRPDRAVIGEPTEMKVIEGHKGCCEVQVHVTGREGHGSRPDLGVNAAEYAMRYATHLLGLQPALEARAPAGSPFTPPWTTINLGKLAGGSAFNVIPGKAEIEWEMRPVAPEDRDFVLEEMEAHIRDVLLPAMTARDPGTGMEMVVAGDIDALLPAAENSARDAVLALTGANDSGTVAFGTEAGIFQSLGTDVVVCGPGSIQQAHKPDEYVSRNQLAQCMDLLDGLVAGLR